MDLTNDFIKVVKAKQQEVVESMVNGRFVNFESYQRYVGIHQGLQEALDILNNLLEEKDSDDSKLRQRTDTRRGVSGS